MNENKATGDDSLLALMQTTAAINEALKQGRRDPKIVDELATLEQRMIGHSAPAGAASIRPSDATHTTKAGVAWIRLSTALDQLELHEAALHAAQQACRHFRLAAAYDEQARSWYPASLDNLGNAFGELEGCFDQALQATQEAVNLYRVLHRNSPKAFAQKLAACLENLCIRLYDLRRYFEAGQVLEEAEALKKQSTSRRSAQF